MKNVICIDTVQLIQVPDDYIECSICGKFCERSSFTDVTGGLPTRTNCYECYMSPSSQNGIKRQRMQEVKRTSKYQSLVQHLRDIASLRASSISVEDMIAALSKLPAGSRLVMTQDGYYADGEFAHLHLPKVYPTNNQYYVIGHSDQSY